MSAGNTTPAPTHPTPPSPVELRELLAVECANLRARLSAAEARADALAEALKPFARAMELVEAGLSVAITRDDGTILVTDYAFERAHELTLSPSTTGEGRD